MEWIGSGSIEPNFVYHEQTYDILAEYELWIIFKVHKEWRRIEANAEVNWKNCLGFGRWSNNLLQCWVRTGLTIRWLVFFWFL